MGGSANWLEEAADSTLWGILPALNPEEIGIFGNKMWTWTLIGQDCGLKESSVEAMEILCNYLVLAEVR